MNPTTEPENPNVCPLCGNHCTKDNLYCKNGMRHFGLIERGAEEPKKYPNVEAYFAAKEAEAAALAAEKAKRQAEKKSGKKEKNPQAPQKDSK